MNTSAPTHIVAGVSRSPASRRAVAAAAREADHREYPLRLVHVLNWLPDVADDPGDTRNLLDEAAAAAADIAPRLTITTEMVEGDPLTGLLHLSRHAAMTVIGDGNLNDLVCLPREGIAVQLTAHASGTVMITRAAPEPNGPVLVGATDDLASRHQLDFAFDAAVLRRTGLLVVHVCEDESRTQALEELVESCARAYGVDTQLHILKGDPTAVVTRESQQASLIVVGPRGQLPYHCLLGSVAQTLLHHGRAPIVVVRGIVPPPRQHTRPDACTTPADIAPDQVSDAPGPSRTGTGSFIKASSMTAAAMR